MGELEDLKKEYDEGKFSEEEQDLEDMITKERDKILAFKNEINSHLKLTKIDSVTALKLYIWLEKKGGVNPPHEVGRELRVIEKEIHDRKKKESVDKNAVAKEWAKKRAKEWRDHETDAYMLLIGLKTDFYKKKLDY